MKRVVFNQKGGVGKSSISVNLAAISAAFGLKTLVIDLDSQANSSHYLGFDQTQPQRAAGISDFLKQTVGWFASPKEAIDFVQPTQFENLYLLAASPELADIERELESRYKIFKIRDALTELEQQFDRIYIDTPPNFNFYSKSALIGADSVLIPFDCDGFSAQAIDHLMANLLELKSDHNPGLTAEGIVVNQFNPQAKLPQQLVQQLIANQGIPVLDSKLSSSVKMRESHHAQTPLIYLAPKHKLTQQFVQLFALLEPEFIVADATEE
ncbi:ParA family protein [Ferrimonas lipolytica]|uniref:ParA family protein n=1 Tax=Ferrimonas lipolytica TaxID=2724191 RepID=A0A6H1UGW5_9GAMM|nr:ParA family protein [Ferrimonas lipolytica]QIZ77563.1 ParA family protein [Ferrimonas lipolytica]